MYSVQEYITITHAKTWNKLELNERCFKKKGNNKNLLPNTPNRALLTAALDIASGIYFFKTPVQAKECTGPKKSTTTGNGEKEDNFNIPNMFIMNGANKNLRTLTKRVKRVGTWAQIKANLNKKTEFV